MVILGELFTQFYGAKIGTLDFWNDLEQVNEQIYPILYPTICSKKNNDISSIPWRLDTYIPGTRQPTSEKKWMEVW